MGEGQGEIRLVYFDIRGLAEPVRWMLKLSGQEFTDERIPLDAWMRKRSSVESLKERRRSLEQKAGGKAKFIAQYPVIFVGNVVVTQPLSVTRYVARKFGFNGSSSIEEARADEVSDLVYDLRLRAFEFEGKNYTSQTPDIGRHTVFRDLRQEAESPKKQKMMDDLKMMWLPLYFQKFNHLLKHSGGEWIAGTSMTYGDLALANIIEICEDLIDPKCLDEFPALRKLKDKIFAMPGIQEWIQQRALLKVEEQEEQRASPKSELD